MTFVAPQRARKRILQTSFVVKDVYDSIRAFLDLYEIGPWFVFEHYPMQNLKYRDSSAKYGFHRGRRVLGFNDDRAGSIA